MQSPNFKSTRQTSRRRPLKLLPGFESTCRLPIPSCRELRTSNFELSTSNFSPPELQIKRQTSCRRPLRLLPALNSELNFTANFESRAASFEFSPPRTSNQARFD